MIGLPDPGTCRDLISTEDQLGQSHHSWYMSSQLTAGRAHGQASNRRKLSSRTTHTVDSREACSHLPRGAVQACRHVLSVCVRARRTRLTGQLPVQIRGRSDWAGQAEARAERVNEGSGAAFGAGREARRRLCEARVSTSPTRRQVSQHELDREQAKQD